MSGIRRQPFEHGLIVIGEATEALGRSSHSGGQSFTQHPIDRDLFLVALAFASIALASLAKRAVYILLVVSNSAHS